MNEQDMKKRLRDLEDLLYEKQMEIDQSEKLIYQRQKTIDSLNKNLKEYKRKYNRLNNSRIWKLTYPLRYALDNIKRISNKSSKGQNKGTAKKKELLRQKEENKYDVPSGYQSVFQDEEKLAINPEVKVIAFNLPQFHSIPENNEWWGKDFTEWTNTKKAVPQYEKHYEPREPHEDIGYYDLSKLETVKKQAEMAKRHGLYGFCYYYYWFSGKRLLEKPVDILLEHPEIDINFCLCWANENWTRTWDGLEKNILIQQKYLEEDAENFIKDIKKYICDHRYIKWNGKPVIVIYAPKLIPNVRNFIVKAKNASIEIGIGEISFWICKYEGTSIHEMGLEELVDKEIEFPPRLVSFPKNVRMNVNCAKGGVIDYCKYADDLLLKYRKKINKYNYRNIRAVMLGWDNSARRKEGYTSFDNFDLFKYYQWLFDTIEETKDKYLPEDRFVFVNAWNEWGEGTYLEPDKKYGYSSINTTSRAIGQLPFGIDLKLYNLKDKNIQSEIFVQIHLFYSDLTDEIITYLNHISEAFDCYITTDTMAKAQEIFAIFLNKCKANYIQVDLFPNRGRDVAPFLMQIQNRFKKYKYFAHIHSKKSVYDNFGNDWREYLLESLFGDEERVNNILTTLRNDTNISVGIIYPATMSTIVKNIEWGCNYLLLSNLMRTIGVPFKTTEQEKPVFPAGNMFWAKTAAVRQLLDFNFTVKDFPFEELQRDGTIMHAIERAWIYIANANGYKSMIIKDSQIIREYEYHLEDTKSLKCYEKWIEQNENKLVIYNDLKYKPMFSVVIPVYNTVTYQLEECIQSVLSQTYDNYELILVDDHSSWENVRSVLRSYENGEKTKVIYRQENGHISQATNDGIDIATGDFIVFIDCDDVIAKDALYLFAEKLNENKELDFIYSDEDRLTEDSKIRHLPFFKPDWSPDLFMSMMFTNHLSAYRTSLVKQVGGLRTAFNGSQDYDLTLRVIEVSDNFRVAHIPKVLYHWREREESVSFSVGSKNYAIEAACRAKEDALRRRGISGYLESVAGTSQYRVVYEVEGNPLVSIIIPSKDNPEILKKCISAIRHVTNYTNYEIIVVDNGSNNQNKNEIEEFLNEYHCRYEYEKREFNFSYMCNLGAKLSNGEYVLFLNDDIEVFQSDWLERMLGQAQQKHTGAVGIKLFYPKTTIIQHDGVINHKNGPSHLFFKQNDQSNFYSYWNKIDFNCLAVTGACLLVSKEKFNSVKGFNEDFPIAYNDVDLCFKLYEKGYYNVLRNDVAAYHHESFSRGLDALSESKLARLKMEMEALYEQHPKLRGYDPFYNPNFGNNMDFLLSIKKKRKKVKKKNTTYYIKRIIVLSRKTAQSLQTHGLVYTLGKIKTKIHNFIK